MKLARSPWFARLLGSSLALTNGLAVTLATAQTATPTTEFADRVKERIDTHFPDLLAAYKDLHTNPELSYDEVRTAGKVAESLKAAGFEVTTGVGGHGVVGILKNGDGPVIMLRADMDALPVLENTGVDYASKIETRDSAGNVVPVMHACGHDLHMTCLLGAARVLVDLKDHWNGTLMMVGQPAEERVGGAKKMLEDGLFTRFPKPRFALAIHCDSYGPIGTVGFTEGMALANVDSVDITVRGRGGHGSAPHTTIDPIVLAARIVVDLQTLVSREIDPLDSAVVTVGSIHGGTKHNIIPNEVKMQLTVRSFKDTTRKHLLDGIERIAKGAAQSARAPEPIVKFDMSEYTPATYNDPPLTRKWVESLRQVIGEKGVIPKPPVMGGEDFSFFGKEGVPICQLRLGTIAPEALAAAASGGPIPPSLHSDKYIPIPEPSIRTGVLTFCVGVHTLIGK